MPSRSQVSALPWHGRPSDTPISVGGTASDSTRRHLSVGVSDKGSISRDSARPSEVCLPTATASWRQESARYVAA